MKKVNLINSEILDINGKQLDKTTMKTVCESLGNALYFSVRDVAVSEIGRDIYKGKEVSMTNEHKEAVKAILNDENKCQLAGFVVIALNKTLDKAFDEK